MGWLGEEGKRYSTASDPQIPQINLCSIWLARILAGVRWGTDPDSRPTTITASSLQSPICLYGNTETKAKASRSCCLKELLTNILGIDEQNVNLPLRCQESKHRMKPVTAILRKRREVLNAYNEAMVQNETSSKCSFFELCCWPWNCWRKGSNNISMWETSITKCGKKFKKTMEAKALQTI